jgi:hypothetical protein
MTQLTEPPAGFAQLAASAQQITSLANNSNHACFSASRGSIIASAISHFHSDPINASFCGRLTAGEWMSNIICVEYRGFWALALMRDGSAQGYWSSGKGGWVEAPAVADVTLWSKDGPALVYASDNRTRMKSAPFFPHNPLH